MKAEINNENKAKFFAMYWGQIVFVNPILSEKPVPNIWVFDGLNTEDFDGEYLELKPLSAITDEDAEEIGFEFNVPSKDVELKFHFDNYDTHWEAKHKGMLKEGNLLLEDTDYLRSRGYALPWMGLSVEELIEAGWIKLKEESK